MVVSSESVSSVPCAEGCSHERALLTCWGNLPFLICTHVSGVKQQFWGWPGKSLRELQFDGVEGNRRKPELDWCLTML